MADASPPQKRQRHDRVSNACDTCKKSKVKCDGNLPCRQCARRHRPEKCSYSAPRPRGASKSAHQTPRSTHSDGDQDSRSATFEHTSLGRQTFRDLRSPLNLPNSNTATEQTNAEDTTVPLEAGLLQDGGGRLMFMGDCAPLSFLQTVRHLVTSMVDPNGFATHTDRDTVIEHAPLAAPRNQALPTISGATAQVCIDKFYASTHGLVDMFDDDQLRRDISHLVLPAVTIRDAKSALCALVLATGFQETDVPQAEIYYAHGSSVTLACFGSDMSIQTIRALALMPIFLLRAFQPNAAFVYFALAARCAYSIGIHRDEVNAHFGPSLHRLRNKIWKSLRVVDLFLSTSLGRPPALSDVDCTVPYGLSDVVSVDNLNILDASVQIFLVLEVVIVKIYSRKQISLRLAAEISQELKAWASRWHEPLSRLLEVSDMGSNAQDRMVINGICQVLCSYYYSVMLLTRPFLVYELHEHLSASQHSRVMTQQLRVEKSNFAHAALNAASLFVELVQRMSGKRQLQHKMPVIVSWLFPTALVLGIAMLGPLGRAFEQLAQDALQCLRYFAVADPHARQYGSIIESFLQTARSSLDAIELRDRIKWAQTSSRLFGLPAPGSVSHPATPAPREVDANNSEASRRLSSAAGPRMHDESVDWIDLDTDFFSLPWYENDGLLGDATGLQTVAEAGGTRLGDLPLFPLSEEAWDDLTFGHTI